jgi:hypothetical protein
MQKSIPPVLLIGYNRPNLLKSRLFEISKMHLNYLYISIDGGSDEMDVNQLYTWPSIKSISKNKVKLNITKRPINLGLTKHIVQSISEVLENHNSIIVVEDDIVLGANFVKNISNGLELLNEQNKVGTVGAFSPLNFRDKNFYKNAWRKSKYFSCWGWGCTKSTWNYYNEKLPDKNFDKELENSSSWNSLSKFQKLIWRSRFQRVILDSTYTWDIQMQYASFLNDFTNLLPIFRFVDNEGFLDEKATHTKGKKPNWFRNGIKNNQLIEKMLKNKILLVILEFIDSIFIAGDSRIIQVHGRIKSRLKSI